MNTFHSWLGRTGGLIALPLVRLEELQPLKFLWEYSFLTVILRRMWTGWASASRRDTLVCTHTFAQRQSHSPAVTPLVLFCLLSSLKSLTCILLSFILLPRLPIFPPLSLSPCGFCHLFTDEWPLHRYDLNVSQFSLYDSLPLSLLLLSPCIPSCPSGHLSNFSPLLAPTIYTHF